MQARKSVLLILDPIDVNPYSPILNDYYDVTAVGDFCDALTAMYSVSKPFALIILQVFYPKTIGLEFLEQLSIMPEFASVPVMLVTNHATPNGIRKAISLGAKAIVTFPINDGRFIDTVKGILYQTGKARLSDPIIKNSLAALRSACLAEKAGETIALTTNLRRIKFPPEFDAAVSDLAALTMTLQYKAAVSAIDKLLG